MKYFKKLEGDRIYLSPRNSDDVEKFTEWLNDFQVTDYTGRSANILTLQGEREYLCNSKEEHVMVIVTKDEDKMIGTVGIEKINFVNRTGTLGVFIGDKNYRDKGYGTEAIKLILEYAFQYVNLNNIMLEVMSYNDRAIRCYEKCGFKEFGRRHQSVYMNGKYYDKVYMEVLKENFECNNIRNKNI